MPKDESLLRILVNICTNIKYNLTFNCVDGYKGLQTKHEIAVTRLSNAYDKCYYFYYLHIFSVWSNCNRPIGFPGLY